MLLQCLEPEVCPALEPEPWRVIRCITAKELMVRDLLMRQEVEAFVPTGLERRQWSDRVKVRTAPLFAGYVFTRYDPERTVELIGSMPYLIDVLKFGGRHALVEDSEIERVRAMAEIPQELDVFDRLVSGTEVRVRSGPMTGCRGVFVALGTKGMICCKITMLGRTVAAQIEREMVEPVKNAELDSSRRHLPAIPQRIPTEHTASAPRR